MSLEKKHILITGASGCVGHYVVELIQQHVPSAQLHLLLRNPKKFKGSSKNVKLHSINFDQPEQLNQLQINQIDTCILIANHWGGWEHSKLVNVDQTLEIIAWSKKRGCSQNIYFSTASILDKNGHVMDLADKLGTSYVRSKYLAYKHIKKSPFAQDVFILFPTLVLGAESPYPISHVSVGLKQIKQWFKYLVFIKLNASFHFLHARDIAAVVVGLLSYKGHRREFILGHAPILLQDAFKNISKKLNINSPFKLPLSRHFILFLLRILRIKHKPWDRYCLKRGHFVFPNTVSPTFFGLPSTYPTFDTVVQKELQS